MNGKQGIGGVGVFILIAILAAAAGLVVYTLGQNSSKTAMKENPVVTETPAPANPTPTGIVSTDTSDEGLAKDSVNVDAMLKSADQDSTRVDAGLNDQQGNLSEQ